VVAAAWRVNRPGREVPLVTAISPHHPKLSVTAESRELPETEQTTNNATATIRSINLVPFVFLKQDIYHLTRTDTTTA